MERTRYLIKFYYIGSGKYFGSQRQIKFETVEDNLIRCLLETNHIQNIETSGFEMASRTDKLVSARGACFTFQSKKPLILMEINSKLPTDIGLWAWCEVREDFSSRFNALIRHYKYILNLSNEKEHIYDLKIMKKACKALQGCHDFQNFSKREQGDIKTIRNLIFADFNKEGEYLVFNFKSRAFLRQQIRRMMTKILEVGSGIISLDAFKQLFDTKDFISYQPSDPIGLILWNIVYEKSVQFVTDDKSYERMVNYFSIMYGKHSLKQKLFRILQHDDVGQ